MTTKEKQRELIVEIMKEDEKSGLYDEPVRKNTAVDLLFLALWTAPKDKFSWHSILKQAKELEKQQIENIFDDGYAMKDIDGEKYYKQNYGDQ